MTSRPRPRVLLADDHAMMLAALERLLAPSCEIVGRFTDAAALLEAAVKLQPDVVVMDLFMPPANGLTMCRQIATALPGTRVVIVSADGDAFIRDEALSAGASGFVEKLRLATELLPAVQAALPRRQPPDSMKESRD